MDWFCWDNLNRKPELFSHEDHGAFRLKFRIVDLRVSVTSGFRVIEFQNSLDWHDFCCHLSRLAVDCSSLIFFYLMFHGSLFRSSMGHWRRRIRHIPDMPWILHEGSWGPIPVLLWKSNSCHCCLLPIGSMYGIYANIGGILMVNVTIYSIHGSYGLLINDIWSLFPCNSHSHRRRKAIGDWHLEMPEFVPSKSPAHSQFRSFRAKNINERLHQTWEIQWWPFISHNWL